MICKIRKTLLIPAVIFVLSSLLYYTAPQYYNWNFCFLSLLLYLIDIIYFFFVVKIKNNYFHILLFFSFFCCNFVYAVIVYPINALYFRLFSLMSNDVFITKSVSLCALGASAYILGYLYRFSYVNRKMQTLNNNNVFFTIRAQSMLLLKTLLILSFVFFLVTAGSDFLMGKFNSISTIGGYALVLFKFFFCNTIIYEFYTKRHLIKGRWFLFWTQIDNFLLILIIVEIILFLRAGERGEIMQLFLLLFCLYNLYITSFKLKVFLPFFLIAVLLMSKIAQTRGVNNPLEDNPYRTEGIVYPVLDVGLDLIAISFSLFEIQEYVNENGYTYGTSTLGFLFSAIPFSQSVFYSLVDFDPKKSTSANLLTQNVEDRLGRELNFGVGTNLIGDLYLVFGSFAVIFLLFFCGQKIYLLLFKVENSNYLPSVITFCICFMYVIYLPRTSIFSLTQPLLWSFILFKIFVKKRITNYC